MRCSIGLSAVAMVFVFGCSSAPKSKEGAARGGSESGGASSQGGETSSAGQTVKGGQGGLSQGGQSARTDFEGPLGRRCDEGTPCETGLECFLASGTEFEEYGPAGGYCSVRCTKDEDCAKLGGGTELDPPRCVALVPQLPESSVCMPGCRLGDPLACGGRDEVACWALSQSATDGTGRACVPLCNYDDQCPLGTVCDGVTNLCSPWANTGGRSLGDDCDPSLESPCYNGICLDFGSGGVCSSYCRRGTFPQCGGDDGADASCAWVDAGDEKAGHADKGMCAEACACNSDCATGAHCEYHEERKELDKPGICSFSSGTGIEQCP
ncbi:MAG: hypothetical protein QM784_35290 [Polyangiaceae bacterium]